MRSEAHPGSDGTGNLVRIAALGGCQFVHLNAHIVLGFVSVQAVSLYTLVGQAKAERSVKADVSSLTFGDRKTRRQGVLPRAWGRVLAFVLPGTVPGSPAAVCAYRHATRSCQHTLRQGCCLPAAAECRRRFSTAEKVETIRRALGWGSKDFGMEGHDGPKL